MDQFYTQADLREIIAYAQGRHVMVVPEIEMPGHFGGHYPEKMVCVARGRQVVAEGRRRTGADHVHRK